MIKVCNLYAGLGGNRKLWPDNEIEVTAVEINPDIAAIYQDFFPNDKMIIGCAHQYLLDHYREYDFIWSSPPCPTHSRLVPIQQANNCKLKYPDMKLYQEIIILQHYFKGKYCIENVIGYYEPLIKPQESGRHYFWTNFFIENFKIKKEIFNSIENMQNIRNTNLDKYNIPDKRLLLRNMVNSKLGLHVFEAAFKNIQLSLLHD